MCMQKLAKNIPYETQWKRRRATLRNISTLNNSSMVKRQTRKWKVKSPSMKAIHVYILTIKGKPLRLNYPNHNTCGDQTPLTKFQNQVIAINQLCSSYRLTGFPGSKRSRLILPRGTNPHPPLFTPSYLYIMLILLRVFQKSLNKKKKNLCIPKISLLHFHISLLHFADS